MPTSPPLPLTLQPRRVHRQGAVGKRHSDRRGGRQLQLANLPEGKKKKERGEE